MELWILFFYFLPRKKMLILLEQEWSYSHTLLNCYGSEKVSFKIPVLRPDEFCMSMSLCCHSESVRQSHKEKIFVFSLFCYATYHFCLIHHSNQCRGTTYLVRLGSHFYSSAHFSVQWSLNHFYTYFSWNTNSENLVSSRKHNTVWLIAELKRGKVIFFFITFPVREASEVDMGR